MVRSLVSIGFVRPVIGWGPARLERCVRPTCFTSGGMPKMKTHSGTKKRFKVTATGKVRGRGAFSSHILEKKSAKRKRQIGRPAVISPPDAHRIKDLLGVKK